MSEIGFYRPSDAYGEFSPYYRATIRIDGRSYKTIEHFYQASKFLGPLADEKSVEYSKLISTTRTPNEANVLGRQRKPGKGQEWAYKLRNQIIKYKGVTIRPDWEYVRDNVMRVGNFHKFYYHNRLRKVLIGTGDSVIIEHTDENKTWSDGGDGCGENKLGIILMEIRELLNPKTDDLILNMIFTKPNDKSTLTIDLTQHDEDDAIHQLIDRLGRGNITSVLNSTPEFNLKFYSRLYKIEVGKLETVIHYSIPK